ncbi:MAG: hypothetical protein C0483_24190 [Pirellula sp.]|nr:hypothetical protein [Pirellula sp.]
MDSNAAWLLLKDEIEKAEWQEAAETAENLLEWLSKKGFPPKVTGSKVVDRIICESTARAVAAWELV